MDDYELVLMGYFIEIDKLRLLLLNWSLIVRITQTIP